MEQKKYSIYENGVLLETTDSRIAFVSSIQVNYPLGEFISIYDYTDTVIVTFENFDIVVLK